MTDNQATISPNDDASTSKPPNNNNNPLLTEHTKFLSSIPPLLQHTFFDTSPTSTVTPETRAELWMTQSDLGEALVNQYSWAIPDERSLNILAEFAPLVEIGAGANGYWARMMQDRGLDVLAYDADPTHGGKIETGAGAKAKAGTKEPFQILKGGPEVLSEMDPKRTLFLCYPDEEVEPDPSSTEPPASLGGACLANFKGTHVIHVGELYGDTLSIDQAPWGRSSSIPFQEQLTKEYHCLLTARLPNWLHVRDTISVWKRSQRCGLVFQEENDEDNDKGDVKDGEEEEEEEVEYKFIPKEEFLPRDVAAPCVAHLLSNPSSSKTDKKRKIDRSTAN